jgi:adenosylcobinamide-GDP ribazoletransferase
VSFRAAVSLLTRIPLAPAVGAGEPAGAVPWFPVVGALVGFAIGGIYALFVWALPPLVAAALAAGAGALITGAFHEDGLADTVDAFGGGWDRDDVVRILEDPRHGTFGVLALVIATIFRVTAIATYGAWAAIAVLGAAHALSRALAVGLMGVVAPARAEGLGAAYARSLSRTRVAIAVGSGVVIAAVLIGPWAAPALVVAILPVAVVGRLAVRKVGGTTGDVLGAAQQLAELAVLAVASAVVVNRWGDLLWWHS